jgi:hypothetical protein
MLLDKNNVEKGGFDLDTPLSDAYEPIAQRLLELIQEYVEACVIPSVM